MTRTQRTLLTWTLISGTVLTLLVTGIDAAGGLQSLERALYARRARWCQFFTPPPTDKLVHLDIDDDSLNAIGRWPWPRNIDAQILDELRQAGARAAAFDVIFPQPERPTSDTGRPGEVTDHDALLSTAMRRFGNVIAATSFTYRSLSTASPSRDRARQILTGDLELSLRELNGRLAAERLPPLSDGDYLDELNLAMVQRVAEAHRALQTMASAAVGEPVASADPSAGGPTTMPSTVPSSAQDDLEIQKLRALLLPKQGSEITWSVQLGMLRDAYKSIGAWQELERRGRPVTPGLPSMLEAESGLPPVESIGGAAARAGFVDEERGEGGVLSEIPLWVRSGDHVYPQLGLAVALAYMGVDLSNVRISQDAITIPRPDGGTLSLPISTDRTEQHGMVGAMFDIPWFGQHNRWDTMYDFPAHATPVRHYPVAGLVWDLIKTRQRIATDNASVDRALAGLLDQVPHDDTPTLTAYQAHKPELGDPTARLRVIDDAMTVLQPALDAYKTSKPQDLTDQDHLILDAVAALKTIRPQAAQLASQLAGKQTELRAAVGGKAVLIGSTATAAADMVVTPIHDQCPGVVVHGAIFNAVLQGYVLHRAPDWVTRLITIAMGLIITAACTVHAGFRSLVAAFSAVAVYCGINGLFLYDYSAQHSIVGLAGPLTVAAVVYLFLTLLRFILERRERELVKQRFQNYVDPTLVKYVLEQEESAPLKGQMKQITVAFSDLAGFTTVTEKLKEKTVDLLNEYLKVMVDVIRKPDWPHKGYINKFLGDGIMFFYGAPYDNADHAADCVATVLAMHKALGPFNELIATRGLPKIGMRIGVSSGPMVVGAAGPDQGSDYTVLGDAVNLGARLEAANKEFGSSTMISGVTADLLGDKYLLRPIARLQVKGKTEAVMTYEPLALTSEATAEQRRFAEMTAAVVNSFIAADFAKCIAATGELEAAFGGSPLVAAYRELSEEYQRDGKPADFNGVVVLHTK
jgi:class 3 adenylate cyclase/CHASE2 domain-containing sensor protein